MLATFKSIGWHYMIYLRWSTLVPNRNPDFLPWSSKKWRPEPDWVQTLTQELAFLLGSAFSGRVCKAAYKMNRHTLVLVRSKVTDASPLTESFSSKPYNSSSRISFPVSVTSFATSFMGNPRRHTVWRWSAFVFNTVCLWFFCIFLLFSVTILNLHLSHFVGMKQVSI